MSFFKEAASALGLEPSVLINGYQIINYNGEALYFEGFRRVLKIDKAEIVLDCKTRILTVAGESLRLFTLEDGTATIKGKIISVTEGAI